MMRNVLMIRRASVMLVSVHVAVNAELELNVMRDVILLFALVLMAVKEMLWLLAVQRELILRLVITAFGDYITIHNKLNIITKIK